MKKIIALALCAAVIAVFLSGCVVVDFSQQGGVEGKGNRESYTFKVGEITEIRVDLLCEIRYYAAPSDTVTFEIQSNLLEYIVVEESGGVLTVRSTRNIHWSSNTPILTVSTPALNRVKLNGAGTFTAYDAITADSFALDVDGAYNGKAELNVNSLTVNMDGASNFTLTGRADTANLVLSGAGTLDALALQARVGTVNLSGVGTVKVNCEERLRIEADGMGTVEYKGSPSVDINKDGMVRIQKVS